MVACLLGIMGLAFLDDIMRRKNKYNAKITEVNGIKFHSAAEARRYLELKLLERAGDISNLELQPRYDFELNGVNMGFYKADFRYFDHSLGQVTEDVKGYRTAMYNLKKKMMKAFYGIDILET